MEGIETMKKNRGFTADERDERDIANGPAKLCQAFGIGREENGIDLLGSEIFLAAASPVASLSVAKSKRIGITKGKGHLWRFSVKGNRWVSR